MGEAGPDPKTARTPAEFVATMRQLRNWADLSYRQLERKADDAGDALPRATISGALARQDLPREELLIAFVRACGGDAATIDAWVQARRRLAMSEEPAALNGVGGTEDAPPEGTVNTATSTDTATASDAATPSDSETPPDTAAGADTGTATGSGSETPSDTAAGADITTVQASTTTESPEQESAPTTPSPARPMPEANGPRRRNRALPAAITSACAIAGVLLLVLLPGAKPGDDKTGAAPPTRISPSAPTPSASSPASPSPSTSPNASPAGSDETDTAPLPGPTTRPTKAPTKNPAPTTPAPAGMPKAGFVRMHPASSSSLCITEGRERNGNTDREIAVQRPCAEAPQPRVYLESLGNQIYRIKWNHPQHGPGCLGADEAPVEGSELLSPSDCTDALGQQYRLEPSGSGYRLHPMDSGMCIGILPPHTEGAEAIQAECTGAGDQVFRFSPL
ncbi:hypothetical protein ACWGI8_07785 [Streptomyces sp. NPDC054841]